MVRFMQRVRIVKDIETTEELSASCFRTEIHEILCRRVKLSRIKTDSYKIYQLRIVPNTEQVKGCEHKHLKEIYWLIILTDPE